MRRVRGCRNRDPALCSLGGGLEAEAGLEGEGPQSLPRDGSAICVLALGAEAGPCLSGQGPGIPFAPLKLPPYKEARATVSRGVCDCQSYLLCCQYIPSLLSAKPWARL